MKSRLLPCFILLILPFGVWSQQFNRLDGSIVRVRNMDEKIEALMKAARVSGLGITIFNERKPVYSKTFGYADVKQKKPFLPQSQLYAASLAKVVFAYVMMQLVEEKKLDLDKPLVAYLDKPLPSYKIEGWNRGYQDLADDLRYTKITGRMCLTHTTGFPNWRWFESDRKLKFKFDPGTRYSYSGEGLYLLQFVAEQITGKDYETLSRERVFAPLGMNHTSQVWLARFDSLICYGHNSNGEPYELMKWKEASAGGSMTSSLEDLSLFFGALLNKKGISDKQFAAMTSRQIRIKSLRQFGPMASVDSTLNDGIQLGYGLGVGVLQSPFGSAYFKEGHDDGWGHYTIYYPEQQIGILILTNNDQGETIFKELLEYAIGDVYTPWQWENYIPYNFDQNSSSARIGK